MFLEAIRKVETSADHVVVYAKEGYEVNDRTETQASRRCRRKRTSVFGCSGTRKKEEEDEEEKAGGHGMSPVIIATIKQF